MQSVVFGANSAWNILNFRMNLIHALAADGFQPVALVPPGEGEAELRGAGVRVQTVGMSPAGTSPFSDALLVVRYLSALRRLRPVAFLGFTAKPNIYGSMAASILRIPTLNNLTGLGTAFIHGGLLDTVVSGLYRVALRRSHQVYFHNHDDLQLFINRGLIAPTQGKVIPGSGVDLKRFRPGKLPGSADRLTFLFIGRLLREKGVCEFVEAASLVRKAFPGARFQILGPEDTGRRAVPRGELEQWIAEGSIEYLGAVKEVRPFIEAADCVVLPSYREGMPRVLLEAAAMARPLIGTDVPGCRHIVEEGVTGFRCTVRSGASLAEAMLRMARLSPPERERMGSRARALVEEHFSEAQVTSIYLSALHSIAGGAQKQPTRCGAL